MRLKSPARGVRTVAAKAAVALAAAAVSLAGVALPAHAADNPNITFSKASLTKIDTSGNPVTDGSALTLDSGNDRVRFSVSWALPEGAPLKADDSFTITLPKELKSQQTTAGGLGKPELKVDLDQDGTPETVVGSCLVELPKFTCTFNEKAVELVGQGGTFQNFSGTVSIQLQAKETTSQEELPFSFSGKPSTINVDLPGTGGIGAGKARLPYTFVPANFGKGSTGIGSSSSEIQFGVGISTSTASSHSLAFKAKQAGKPITFDGSEKTLTFTDTIGSGLKFDDPANWKFSFIDSKATDTDAPDVLLATGNGTPTQSEKGTWTLKVTPGQAGPDGQVATLSITGPFEVDANYSLAYKGLPSEGGKLKPGFKYENVITYDDAKISAEYSRSFAPAFTAEVNLDPAYASFAVTKYVAGPGASQVAQGTEFTVKATYELPSVNGVQQTVDSYPGWKAPGTVNAAKTGGEVSLVAKVGERVIFSGTAATRALPAGTKVTLAEVQNPAAAPAGYAWESFTFTLQDQKVTELTLGRGQVTAVDLTNRLKKLPVGRFAVTKTVEGLAAGATAPAEFTFSYVCDDAARTTGELKVPGDGSAVVSPEILAGTRCTVSEEVSAAEVAGHQLTPFQAQQVTIPADSTVKVAATNTYTRNLVSVGDLVWLDANRNGQQDADEQPVKDVKVTLVDAKGATVAETRTDASGNYWFKDLAAGAEYKLVFEAPAGTTWTAQDQGDDASDSDVDANGAVSFTAPLQGRNEGGAKVVDVPVLDAGLVKVEAPATPAPSPTPSAAPSPVPSPTPSAAPSEPAKSATPTAPAAPTTPSALVEPVKPTKPAKPSVMPGLPRTGR